MTTVFEEKSISKAILRVGLPAMLGQLTTLIYNIADTYFVSLTKEPAMIAAVTLCTPILLIIMSIASIFGMGGNSAIARLLGENEDGKVRRTLNFCMYAMAIAGVAIMLAGMVFIEPLARLSGADAENMAYTCDYLKYIFLGAPFIIISNGAVHLFRSIGFIKESTIGLALGNESWTDTQTRDSAYAAVIEFNRRFKERFGTLICRELLGCDTSTPEGKKVMAEHPEKQQQCLVYITEAERMARDIIAEWSKTR